MCLYLNCTSLCCNSYGTCPENYSSRSGSRYTSCSTYYKDLTITDTMPLGVWVGIGFGGILFFAILLSVICYCYRRKKA